ncbi:unnamed protein product [Polarella glacialis]|uniref:Uncharacterized protein n=1 Tax=Polarella glacialis TaxID=89957 RepID=A0A813JMV1_POLGL|nr:unnamed protein product [Polarella glacialis]
MISDYADKYGSAAAQKGKPARAVPKIEGYYEPIKAEKKVEDARHELHWRHITEARAKDKRRRDGNRSNIGFGTLTTALKPPMSEVHYNFDGGPTCLASCWKSDYRANMTVGVHSSSNNSKMAQPTKLALCVASPISGFPGVIGDPNM